MVEKVHVAQSDPTGVERAIQVRAGNPSGAYLGSHAGLVWLNTDDNKMYREEGGSAVAVTADVDLSGYAIVDHSHAGYESVETVTIEDKIENVYSNDGDVTVTYTKRGKLVHCHYVGQHTTASKFGSSDPVLTSGIPEGYRPARLTRFPSWVQRSGTSHWGFAYIDVSGAVSWKSPNGLWVSGAPVGIYDAEWFWTTD